MYSYISARSIDSNYKFIDCPRARIVNVKRNEFFNYQEKKDITEKRNYFKGRTESNNENISKGKLKEMKKYLIEKTERNMKCKFYPNIKLK